MKKRRIYLDYNATTPCRDEVLRVMERVTRDVYGNPSSAHEEGRKARTIVEDARDTIAAALGANPLEIIFTSGGTEANNMALLGFVAGINRKDPRIVTSAIEHPSVLNTCRFLKSHGISVTFIGCDQTGRIDPKEVIRATDGSTVLVSIMHANNEVGTIQPIAEIASFARKKGVFLHCDAVQSFGKIPIDVRKLDVDMLAISGHKICGPKGVGVLYVRKGTPFAHVCYGGSQERTRRAGTENVVGIAGFAAAAVEAMKRRAAETKRLLRLKKILLDCFKTELPDAVVNGHPTLCLPNTLNISFARLSGEDIMMALDLECIAVSTGSACAVGARKPSHVLDAMGIDKGRRCGSIRFSLGYRTTESEIRTAARTVVATVKRLVKSGQTCCKT